MATATTDEKKPEIVETTQVYCSASDTDQTGYDGSAGLGNGDQTSPEPSTARLILSLSGLWVRTYLLDDDQLPT